MNEQIHREILAKGLRNLKIDFDDQIVRSFLRYLELLMQTNKEFNLTSITDPEEAIYKHFIDSLTVIPFLPEQNNQKTIDIGTGAGFPGIPVKIIKPNLKVTLVDSTKKKVNFLRVICDELKLKDVECIHARAEELARNTKHREIYDIALSRALAPLNLLLELCLPFVKAGGTFIAYKSKEAHNEIKKAERALELLGGRILNVKKLEVPGIEGERNLIFIKKMTCISSAYPRRPGIPQKRPIE
ncbi:16S rRNA (guanine(527)-N(7))-methyltransferase RsmG [Desulfitibacter alkalitolerans]|uniref:16S rRNA (guanine(527)-N(7))-methyltransferase RsmG n=1 Tax=Desulfitibacter alkalitolerans TaxID=264641 RepID=UPI0005560973|nr:16S rRNA (guanine(527)-N(7))-methyltransferase RsmG [Desulfitibacter alkalitolerans]